MPFGVKPILLTSPNLLGDVFVYLDIFFIYRRIYF